MNRFLLTLSFLFLLTFINSPVLAEVNIDLLKQKYPKCEDVSYRHECFDENSFSNSKDIGYFRNNHLWDGIHYQNNILISEYIKGKRVSKSSCTKSNEGWFYCPSGTRYKPFGNGYSDQNGKQGNYIIQFESGNKYIGNHKNERRNGKGTFTWKSGGRYVGEFKDDKMHGQGKYTYANGKVKEGIFKDNKFMYTNKSTPISNPKIEGYKRFCSEIGFTPGTEKFGECVVEAMKKG